MNNINLDLDFFKQMLLINSTSGQERGFAEFLINEIPNHSYNFIPKIDKFEVGDGTLNLLCSWGSPKVYFCSHLDTVPPYIAPIFLEDRVLGRGTCDAKGQIFSMFTACISLAQQGYTNFGLLLLAGEETGSFGAKAYNKNCQGGDLIIVGEPTDNKCAVASKGTKAFSINILGKACHSGYPNLGKSAVDGFVDFMNKLKLINFPNDPILGETTYNVGKLESNNPQNILSDKLSFRLYFRTTPVSDNFVVNIIQSMACDYIEIENLGGDNPMAYYSFPNMPTCTVAFGSDAPRLNKFKHRALCGPGSIFVAHKSEEYILIEDIKIAVKQYVNMAKYYLDM